MNQGIEGEMNNFKETPKNQREILINGIIEHIRALMKVVVPHKDLNELMGKDFSHYLDSSRNIEETIKEGLSDETPERLETLLSNIEVYRKDKGI